MRTKIQATGTHTLRWGACIMGLVVVYSLTCVQLLATPWTVQHARLLCPWGFPGKNTGVDCHFLLQGNLPKPGTEPLSPARAKFFTGETTEKPHKGVTRKNCLAIKYTSMLWPSKPTPGYLLIRNEGTRVCVCMLSHFSHVWLFATLWTVACQAPLSMGILQARILECLEKVKKAWNLYNKEF